MLLVDDDQARLRELNFLLQQSMRADHELRVSLRDVAADFALAVGFQRAGQQDDAVSGILQNSARGKIMLLRENFRGRHQRHLITIFDGDDRRLKTDNGFSRPHISLQQTPHGIRLLHVVGDLFQDSLLRRRGMKGQNFLDRLPHPIVQAKRDSGLRLLLASLEFQSQLDKKQFFKDQPDVRRRARRLQIFEALASLGPVHFPQRLTRRKQRQTPAHGRRNGFRQIGSQIVQSLADDSPKPARGHAALPGRLVDGHDASDFERRCRLVVRVFCAGIAQHLKLRLNDLQFATLRILLHLPIERDQLAGLEFVLQISGIEPEAAQPGSSLPHGQLKDRHAAGAKQARVADFADDGSHFAGAQLRDPARIQPVFIAKRQIIEQIADCCNSLGGENLRQLRTNSFDVLDWRGEFEHLGFSRNGSRANIMENAL